MDAIFKQYPDIEAYYQTADGHKFFTETDAKNHAVTLKNKAVKKVEKHTVKSDDTKTTEAILAEIAQAKTIAEVKTIAEGINTVKVKKAVVEKIKAIEKAEAKAKAEQEAKKKGAEAGKNKEIATPQRVGARNDKETNTNPNK